jgi:hypothetical protein
MRLRINCLAAILAIGLNTPAHASWHVARSKHFIIYADEKPNRLAEFSTRLEYCKAYVSEGVRPTDNAIAALHYASDLAPQDLGLRMNSAVAYLNEGKPKEARSTLVLVAYSPHAGAVAALARRMISRIDANDPRGALLGAGAGATDEAKTP